MPDLCDDLARWTPTTERFARWNAQEPELAGFDLPTLAATLLDRATPHERRDALLAALVRLARADADAASAVAVCLLPGVRRHAHRLAARQQREDVCAEMLAQLLAHVRSYDLTRRPARIAANLLLDAMSHTLAAVRAEYAWQAATRPLDEADLPATPPPDDPDPLDLAAQRGIVSPADAALIRATRSNGLELAAVASLLGMTYDGAKKRRQRAEAALVAWLAPERLARRRAA